jgi:hypothetical protein
MSPSPPSGVRRPDGEAPRSYRPPGGGTERLAPISRPMGGMRGSIADTIAGARASLKNPSRPFTPADPLRRLSAHSLVQSLRSTVRVDFYRKMHEGTDF